MVSIDFFTVPTATLKVLFVFVVLEHRRREVLHFNVTANATSEWTAQQIVEAFAYRTPSRYLIRDRDGVYGNAVRLRIRSLGGRGGPHGVPERLAECLRRATDRLRSARVTEPFRHLTPIDLNAHWAFPRDAYDAVPDELRTLSLESHFSRNGRPRRIRLRRHATP